MPMPPDATGKRATSHPLGRARSSRRLFRQTAAAAAALVLLVPAFGARGAVAATGSVWFSDGFESGDFSAWSSVTTGGDGSAVVQQTLVRAGSFAAQLAASATTGSKAYVRKTLASAQPDVTVSGDFRVLQQGASGGNVPFFRLLDPVSSRLVSVYRQNGSTGTIGVGYGGGNFTTAGRLALDTWATVAVHVVVNGGASTVEVFLNDTLVYQTGAASLSNAGVATIQIGNDTAAQAFSLVTDTIGVQSGSSVSPPVSTGAPTIAGSAVEGATLATDGGSWSGGLPMTYTYQWLRCDTGGAGCAAIASAVGATYAVSADDVGSTIRVAVTASNSAGSAEATSDPTATVAASTVPADVVALWHMDETSGSLMLDSVGGHTGTLEYVETGLAGFLGYAYGFNGASTYVTVPDEPDLSPGDSDLTITIALKTSGTPPPSPDDWDLIRKGLYTSVGGEYQIELQSTGRASCTFKGSLAYIEEFSAGPAVNDGQWHTIQCIKTSTTIGLGIDGQLFTTAISIGSISNTDAVVIGARPGSDWYSGLLDEASIEISGSGSGGGSGGGGTSTATVPDAPGALAAAAGDGTIHLSWTAPTSDGGSAVTGYEIRRSTVSGAETLLTTLSASAGASYDDGAVANGTAYYYTVSAVNAVGAGPPSNEASATPQQVPLAPPTGLVASPATGRGVQLTWTASSDPAVTSYTVYRRATDADGAFAAVASTVSTAYKDSSTVRGVVYWYEVTARDAQGRESAAAGPASATAR